MACARALHRAGKDFRLLESSDALGGRIQTDVERGFLLDRGFQVILTAYPEFKSQFASEQLDLKTFYPGALIRSQGRWQRLADPLRRPLASARSLFNSIGSVEDKLRVGQLKFFPGSLDSLPPNLSTAECLASLKFSPSMRERFWKPFLGGVFLEPELTTAAAKFASVFRYFSEGDIAIPARGMRAIPEALSRELPANRIQLNTRVQAIDGKSARLDDGSSLAADHIVIATPEMENARLLKLGNSQLSSNRTRCFYFEAPRLQPNDEPILALNGDRSGPVNNATIMTAVSSAYAPRDRRLVSATVIDPDWIDHPDALELTRLQIQDWFPSPISEWRFLKEYDIRSALPRQTEFHNKPLILQSGLYQCGDHCGLASLNTALETGKKVAEAIIESS